VLIPSIPTPTPNPLALLLLARNDKAKPVLACSRHATQHSVHCTQYDEQYYDVLAPKGAACVVGFHDALALAAIRVFTIRSNQVAAPLPTQSRPSTDTPIGFDHYVHILPAQKPTTPPFPSSPCSPTSLPDTETTSDGRTQRLQLNVLVEFRVAEGRWQSKSPFMAARPRCAVLLSPRLISEPCRVRDIG